MSWTRFKDVSGEVLARTLKRALDVATEVRAFEWGRQVRAVEVISFGIVDDDYLLERSGRPATVLVRGNDLTAKGSVFELLQVAIREHSDPEVVDLRFRTGSCCRRKRRAPAVRPAW